MIFPQTGEVPDLNLNKKLFKVEYWPRMVKYWLRMVKYWLLDGEVLALGWVNSGPETLPEELGTVLGGNKANGWLYRQN